MFKKIKKILLQIGFLKLDTLEKKIDYLIDNLDKIDLYKGTYRSKYCMFIEKDILIYTKSLSEINKFEIDTKYITVKKITENSLSNVTFLKWCSDNNRVIEDRALVIKNFLLECKDFITLFKIASSSINSNILYSNSLKIKPYYYNIEIIIDNILEDIVI